MNPDSPEFEQLRRLLALKRHEQPPPGYFNRFSREVVVRIKAGDRGETVVAGSWLQKLWNLLETKPVFAGAFGASVCAVLITGILNSEGTGAIAGTVPATPAGGPFITPSSVALNEAPAAGANLNSGGTADPSLNSLFDFHLSASSQNDNYSVLPANVMIPAGN
ncbi:MAG TPA: hypothetical protein VK327_09470 [Candidatus Paceibacterota bacterium]|nr:hypothetical protein [Candidatus Paceibacterota bacterium]